VLHYPVAVLASPKAIDYKYSMRFDDLIKKPAKPQKPLTYTESLQAKLDTEMSAKPTPKFTALEYAMMEGGHSMEKK